METTKMYLTDLSTEEAKQIEGGNPVGAAAGAALAAIAIAYAVGYSRGKNDCLPPPCAE